jgi:ATP-dependent protease HslVU (ClpYQ) peptidase subunit
MSVVSVKVYKDTIKIAADTGMFYGDSKRTGSGAYSKLAKVNNMIIGFVGRTEEGSLMMHYADTHKPLAANEKDILSFIIEFSQWKSNITGQSNIENEYIIIYDGKVFYVEKMFVFEVDNYRAIGAGMDFANAAMYLGHTPKEAVKVACELSCWVAEPIVEFEENR